MDSALKTLQLLRVAMFVSIVFYVVIPQLLSPKGSPDPVILYALTLLSALMAGIIFFIRRRMIVPAEALLRQDRSDAEALVRWRTGYVVHFALAEAIGLYGLVARFLGFPLTQAAPFYLAALVLLAFLGPTRIRTEVE